MLCTGMAVIALMYMLGHRDLILFLGKESTVGHITGVHQPAPGAVRASDYQVAYEFTDSSGLTNMGEDVLPPAHPPAEDGVIEVVYSSYDPSVSRIASQHSL